MRGKHQNHYTVSQEIKNSVRAHIDSIPRIESHYLRDQTSREYIDGGRCISEIYRDYQKERLEANLPYCNLVMFTKIFNEEYNIGFFVPKKDQCDLCVSFQNAEGSEKESLSEKFNSHQKEKQLSRKEKEADKNKVGPSYIVAVYDLQAVLPTPRGDVSKFYYKSRLNNFNFSITELKTGCTECYFWHEGEGNRGADEIASCVLKFIEKKSLSTEENLDFVFYSDNCCGQQKNKFMISMYIYSIMKFKNIKSITHKYLITGHTQNEGDSVHSTIEKEIKRALRSGPIYVPSHYAQLIRTSKKRGDPYHLNELDHSDFFAIKDLVLQLNLTFASVRISEIKVFQIEKTHPTKLKYKNSYEDSEFNYTDISKRNNSPKVLPGLKKAYKGSLKIKENKKKDLLQLVNEHHIPKVHAPFYNSLRV